ncbi:hypothetical protein PWT90_01825 [Aphanocladium album]|nr:hypothetical protein PWT90_01825 [Aphanocladium album]
MLTTRKFSIYSLRRVKCDEMRPICERCVKAGVDCQGYELPTSPQLDALVHLSRGSAAANLGTAEKSQQTGRWARLWKEPLPPDWIFMQSYRFSTSNLDVENIAPARVQDEGQVIHPIFPMRPVGLNNFLLHIVCDQLSRASKARNTVLRPNEDAAFSSLSRQYHTCTAQALSFVNEHIQTGAPHSPAVFLIGVLGLTVTDELVEEPIWQAHYRGAFTYVKHKAPLLLAVIHISRLRSLVANHGPRSCDIASAQKIFDSIAQFDPVTWSNNYPDQEQNRLELARIFITAVRLYGILSLPQLALAAGWTTSSGPSQSVSAGHTFEALRRQQIPKFLEQLRRARDRLKTARPLLWPLMVAGVAAAGSGAAAAEYQAFVWECMSAIWADARLDKPQRA